MKALAAVLCACAAAPAIASCPAPPAQARVIEQGALRAAWWTEPAPITVGQPFVMRLLLCPVGAQLLRVDATMPEHRHGMNYKPGVQALGSGQWRVEGLLWHMAGRWELRLDVADGVHAQRLLQSVQLP